MRKNWCPSTCVSDTAWLGPDHACADQSHVFNEGSYGLGMGGSEGLRLVDEESYRRLIWNTDLPPRVKEHMIAHYDSAIRATDERLGRVFSALKSQGLLRRTLVVVTSDHGESLGENGYLQHGPRVGEPVLRVPLVIRLPDDHPLRLRSGIQVRDLVRTIDILPTVLEIVGVPSPSGIDGVSLVPLLEGKEIAPLWAYAETGSSFGRVDPELHLPGVPGKHRAVRTDRWKLIRIPLERGVENRLYDLTQDPAESRDVAAEHPGVVRELDMLLSSVTSGDRELGTETVITPEQREALRALGYAD